MQYAISKQQLLKDLYRAYYKAGRHKRSKPYLAAFEKHREQNMSSLCDDLWNRTYKPLPSQCFIITEPKKREVFAADFRDRIVHHLYFDYVHEMFERTFIRDSYSCIKNRGTHYGIGRLESHIRKESQNYTVPCYVLKMDIMGYFMHINRQKLLDIALETLTRMGQHRISEHGISRWCEVVDMNFVEYLTRELVLPNPTECCRIVGSVSDWDGLPETKSLFYSPAGCGLPIGNLTSQLFSNVYMNRFDQFMKRELKCRHYGRYVDDSYVVSADREYLHGIIPQARRFLCDELGLSLHDGKLSISDVRQGVAFLGAYIKPGRKYVSNSTLHHIKEKIPKLDRDSDVSRVMASMNSFLGVLSHYRSYRIQKEICGSINAPWKYGKIISGKRGLKMVLYRGPVEKVLCR